MKKFVICVSCLFMGLFAFSGMVYAAGTSTASLTVTASIQPYAVVQADSLNFGDLGGGGNYATATISVWATNGLSYLIALNAGAFYDGMRRLANEAQDQFIPYELSTEEGGGSDWGDEGYDNTFPAPPAGPFIGDGTTWQDYTVYGMINIGEGVVADYYEDYVLVTVIY